MAKQKIFLVPQDILTQRLDCWLALSQGESRQVWIRRLRHGEIFLRGKKVLPSLRLEGGEELLWLCPQEKDEGLRARIVHEDSHLLVVEKPHDLCVYGMGGRVGLIDQFKEHHLTGGEDPLRRGVVHRLDRGTTGLLLLAKTQKSWLSLTQQFRNRTIKRFYRALIWGRLPEPRVSYEGYLARSQRDRKRFVAVESGEPVLGKSRWARTHWLEKAYFPSSKISLVEIRLETGRTHQIRVHSQYQGYPLLGDEIYGPRKKKTSKPLYKRPMLHACFLGFQHPEGSWKEFYSPDPEDFAQTLSSLV